MAITVREISRSFITIAALFVAIFVAFTASPKVVLT